MIANGILPRGEHGIAVATEIAAAAGFFAAAGTAPVAVIAPAPIRFFLLLLLQLL